MIWINFPAFAITAIILWIASIILNTFFSKKKTLEYFSLIISFIGIIVIFSFIVLLWKALERPPLRTLGETRLWYAFFLPIVGIISYFRLKYKWFLSFTMLVAIVFLCVDLLHPEYYSKSLMPALQSPWFVPHVTVYILSYALMAAAALVAIKGLYYMRIKQFDNQTLSLIDSLVYIGFAFFTIGLLFGALWAKEAWGHYWTWDPKETWAFITWMLYILYFHLRYANPKNHKIAMWLLIFGFITLLICWFGVNYLPSAQNSVHVYSRG